ncbi:MAG: DMT family transporter [Planctomycetales bacterium]|nr:DMT family transporter [Planctomycetales bacterium]
MSLAKDGADFGRHPIGLAGASLALLTVVLWGANPVAVRFSLDRLPPITVSGIRFALASLVMALWCLTARSPFRIQRGQWTPIFVCGILLYLQIGLFTIGCAWSNASHTSLIVNSFALGVVLIEHFVTRAERLNAIRARGVALATAGVPLVFLAASGPKAASSEAPSIVGDLVLLGSGMLLSIKVVYTKRAVRRVPSGTLIFWHDVIGAGLFLLTAACIEQTPPGPWGWPCVLGLAYQGLLVAGLCFGIQAYLLSRHAASHVTMFNFATPLVGVAAGVLFRGEQMSGWLFVAGLLVATGILIVNRGDQLLAALSGLRPTNK